MRVRPQSPSLRSLNHCILHVVISLTFHMAIVGFANEETECREDADSPEVAGLAAEGQRPRSRALTPKLRVLRQRQLTTLGPTDPRRGDRIVGGNKTVTQTCQRKDRDFWAARAAVTRKGFPAHAGCGLHRERRPVSGLPFSDGHPATLRAGLHTLDSKTQSPSAIAMEGGVTLRPFTPLSYPTNSAST